MAWPRRSRRSRGPPRRDNRCGQDEGLRGEGLVDGDVDAAKPRPIHPRERREVGAGINDRDIHRLADLLRLHNPHFNDPLGLFHCHHHGRTPDRGQLERLRQQAVRVQHESDSDALVESTSDVDLAADTSHDMVMRGCRACLSLSRVKLSCSDSLKDVVVLKRCKLGWRLVHTRLE
jgi:hypothetical protein